MELLASEQPGMAREARRALEPHALVLDRGQLGRLFRDDPRPDVRKHALLLLARLWKWDALPYLVQAAADPDPEFARRGVALLHRWLWTFNQSFMQPSPAQREAARQALAECWRRLPAARAREIGSLAELR